MSKQTYWLADDLGGLITVEGAAVRDEYAAEGWQVVDTPPNGARMWMQHSEHGGWALFPVDIREVWEARGWQPAIPTSVRTDTGLAAVNLSAQQPQTIASVPEPPAEEFGDEAPDEPLARENVGGKP